MTFIIAEAGVNHDGHIRKAMKMVDIAVDCGADAIKFQVFSSELLEPPGERREMLKKLELTQPQFLELREYCGTRIEFMATAFDVNSLEFLLGLGIKRIKISSGQLTDRAMLAYAEGSGRPVIISTGMASGADVEEAMRALKYSAAVTILQCTSAYPAPPEDINLKAMVGIGRSFGCQYGLSDHSLSTVIPAAAVALGASVIEKHFTMSRSDVGPDHRMSLEPFDLRRMIVGIRHVEKAMGDGVKRPTSSENEVISIVKGRVAWAADRRKPK